MTNLETAGNSVLDKLRKLDGSDKLAHLFLLTMAARERPRETTDLKRARLELEAMHNVSYSNSDFVALGEKLQAIGLGELKKSRHPQNPSRFIWNCNCVQTARAIVGAPARNMSPPAHFSGAPLLPSGFMLMPIRIRGQLVQIPIPADINKADIESIKASLLAVAV